MDALELLLTRRSPFADHLGTPVPDGADLDTILRAGMRVPDHGLIKPWRIQILRSEGQRALADVVEAVYRRENPEVSDEKIAIERQRPLRGPMMLCVTSHPDPSRAAKVPVIEQQMSAGAMCQNIVLAAHALGYGAQWLTGWPAHHRDVKVALGHDPATEIIGFIFIGTPTLDPGERPRPKADDIVSEWRG